MACRPFQHAGNPHSPTQFAGAQEAPPLPYRRNKVCPKPAITLLSRKDWHSAALGAVLCQSRAHVALRDPAPPARWPRWGFGGAARRRHQPKRRISMSKSAKKRSPRTAHTETTAAKPSSLAMANPPRPYKADPGLEAVSRHRDAAIARRCDDCCDDESHGLAAAFGARIPCWRGAQAPQAQARVEEGGRHPRLPDRWRGKEQARASQVRAPDLEARH